ncbi:hypothetical protein COLO4_27832 [Corchorus olitorius]|uniref:Protein kinase domain-containing protein n=1 Tax=Corchorus olitorius TaxID=93759 RepID=A0A1R3HNW3_9ROSI|nr:hypothetical protein COLO4_27832 [Corchorus olitorius]
MALWLQQNLSDSLAYVPLENVALNCGSSAEQSLFDGRNWSTDVGSQYAASNLDSNSTVSVASKGTAIPAVPYTTGRLFYSKFSYNFNVTPGPKFIRLYFYSDSYLGLDASEAFLTVTAGRYTLLRNFSSYLTSKYLNEDYFFKEFIVHVENQTLELTFSPSSNSPNAYGFVNGIEVVSMPLHLYTRGDDVPIPFVGFLPNMLTVDNNSALEMVYRANVGGQTIPPDQDTGMFRTWNADESYIFGAAYGQIDFDNTLSVQYPKTAPAYTAPGDVYRTARSMAERQADVMVWSKGHGVPVYRDYVVMIPQQAVSKQDLWLELHPNIRVKPEYYDAILNGVEIFKVSDYFGNLAGLNPPLDEANALPSPSASEKSKKGLQKQIIKYSLDTAVAIKRGMKATSEGSLSEEIKVLSQIRHNNVISLLGYCKEDLEIILVYEYTDNGPLSDHLFSIDPRKKPLTWNQRLEICVGVARGLHHLHTGEKRPILHCEISTSNILLDKSWRAKISNFESITTSYDSNGSDVNGGFSSLDSDCCSKNDMESDMYLFGLVMLEVLTGRPAPINLKAEDDENGDSYDDNESLIPSVSYCLDKGDAVDIHLRGKVPSESILNFKKITKQCLAKIKVKPPTLTEVLNNLEQLVVREDSDSNASPKGLYYPQSNSDLMFGVEFSENMMSCGR